MPTKTSPTKYPTATTTAGQRRQVYEGRALMTRGGLTKANLRKSKTGKIVSIKASNAAKKNYKANGLAQFQYRGDDDWTAFVASARRSPK